MVAELVDGSCEEEEEEGGGRWGLMTERSWEREAQVGDTLRHPATTPDEL